MMRTPSAYAIAVRKADGTIVNTSARLPKWSDKYPILKLPVLRGSAVLVQSMGLGIKALNYSANEAFADAQEAETEEVRVALTPAVIEGEGRLCRLNWRSAGAFPSPHAETFAGRIEKRRHSGCRRIDHLCYDFQCPPFRRRSPPFNECTFHRRRLGPVPLSFGKSATRPVAMSQMFRIERTPPRLKTKPGIPAGGGASRLICIRFVHLWVST